MAQAKGGATGTAPGAAQTDQNGAANGKASARPEGAPSPTTAAEAAEQLHQEWVRAHGGQAGAGAATGNASQRN
jgi:hypothetical protein